MAVACHLWALHPHPRASPPHHMRWRFDLPWEVGRGPWVDPPCPAEELPRASLPTRFPLPRGDSSAQMELPGPFLEKGLCDKGFDMEACFLFKEPLRALCRSATAHYPAAPRCTGSPGRLLLAQPLCARTDRHAQLHAGASRLAVSALGLALRDLAVHAPQCERTCGRGHRCVCKCTAEGPQQLRTLFVPPEGSK